MQILSRLISSLLLLVLTAYCILGQVDQIGIDRVADMPELPSPYQLRDWKAVAKAYDAIVFDLQKQGDYLPLIFIDDSGLNYPQNPSFGLKTYVGSFNQTSGEGINVLSALVGASLVGIDKSSQNGHNWILYSQDYFNHANNENIYLNNIGGRSGIDWWYDMMPNVYFYQLYDLYGSIGEADTQFVMIADRMVQAVQQMGGGDTPWSRPNMNFRAWNFVSGAPTEQGVIEPEAAGSFAWLLYHAYKILDHPEYLKGAEWSIEFLNNLGTNPSYELQLPYGAYIAAKMNAEVGTSYNLEKLMFWIFNRGPLRGWGTVKGTWGGLDVSGLVGEANDQGNDYAFQLNGMQQAAALVPMVRYDKRFAQVVAKWVLNLANATRLMYPGFLPSAMQDASEWSMQYDPDGVIGYEAMREQFNGLSPFATGDAVKGGWAATNLSLYSTSSVGYLGALIDTTNISQILKLDLLVTDFYRSPAFPSYLIYNPHGDEQRIDLDVGEKSVNIYDAISETLLFEDVSGSVDIPMASQQTISLVLVPSDATITTEFNLLKANDTIIDFMQSKVAFDRPPRIKALALDNNIIEIGDTALAFATAEDLESKNVVLTWSTDAGEIIGDGDRIQWLPTQMVGTYELHLKVEDEAGQTDSAVVHLEVVEEVNFAPTIDGIEADNLYLPLQQAIEIRCLASDANDDPLAYQWSVDGGNLVAQEAIASWESPNTPGIYTIQVIVTDDKGAAQSASLQLLTYNYTRPSNADLVAHYPFDGDADDVSGNEFHGQVMGAKLTDDELGNSNSAYFFDGNNDHISVANDDRLNFTDGITVAFWTTPLALPERETFIISHGSWNNRWKISAIPDRNLRWTVKTQDGSVGDLDTKLRLEEDSSYHVAVTYDQQFMSIYIDGQLNSFQRLSGQINPSPVGLEIAQMLPDNQSLNYRGVIDDLRIYDYALAPDSIALRFSSISTSATENDRTVKIKLFPNPAVQEIFIDFFDPRWPSRNLTVDIINPIGEVMLSKNKKQFLTHKVDVQSLPAGIYYIRIKDTEQDLVAIETLIKL